VPPSEAERVREILPSATVEYLRGLGHLAHEERPSEVAARVKAAAERFGVLGH
jgi:magnesium chelatase accessory protein